MKFNPDWPEIKALLQSGESYADRPDVVERVFEMKKNLLFEFILDYCAFGEVEAYTWTQEWQKRLLPHIHLLLTLKRNSKILTGNHNRS